jgi:hypothetical protein
VHFPLSQIIKLVQDHVLNKNPRLVVVGRGRYSSNLRRQCSYSSGYSKDMSIPCSQLSEDLLFKWFNKIMASAQTSWVAMPLLITIETFFNE